MFQKRSYCRHQIWINTYEDFDHGRRRFWLGTRSILISKTKYRVINVDKLTCAGNLQNLASVNSSSRYAFEKIDICNGSQLAKVFSEHQPDAVMHLAAESHVDRSING